MGKRAWVQNRFDGGWSTDPQIGTENSFAYSEHLEFRKKPSQLSVIPKPRNEGANVVVDLVQNEVMDNSGKIYALGSEGWLYRRTTAGVWSSEAKLDDGTFGLSYRSDIDKIFATSSTTVSEYSPVSNNPTIKVNKYGKSKSTTSITTGGTLTYTVPTAISETAGNYKSYTLDIEPLKSVKLEVVDKGTGDWTVVIHDEANNELGTTTVTNANLTSGESNEFIFTNQIRQYVKPNARTYHFHVKSTVADGTIAVSTAGDMSTCDYELYADRLIDTVNGLHPILTFLQYETIGNGNYLSVWEPLSDDPSNLEWLRHRLVFPAGLEVCGLAQWNEYEAIACERVSSTSTLSPQMGYIFFWDGLSSTYNYYISVPEGSPRSIHEHKNVLYWEAGGDWYAYAGGEAVKIRNMPFSDVDYTENDEKTLVNPYMATVRKGVHMLGYPTSSINYDLPYGVYSYGSVNKNFPDSFGYMYSISTGSKYTTGDGTDLKIGMVKNFGDKLHISWYNNGNYGLDIVDSSSTPYTSAVWESVFYEGELPTKQKTALYMESAFKSLPTGASITLKYRLEREGAWQESTAVSTGDYARFDINKRFYEIQVGFELTLDAGLSESPEVNCITLIFDDNTKEQLS